MSERRRYSDHERAEALAALDANGGNVKRTAEQIGVPHKTLDEWAKGRVHDDVADIRNVKRADIAERLDAIAHVLVDAIPGKVADATLQQIATSLGITIDKMQLLRGKPTTINRDDGPLSDDERRELDELISKRGTAPPDAPTETRGA